MQFSYETCSPVRQNALHFNSHVLGLLQAFTLSQDQTHLNIKVAWTKFFFYQFFNFKFSFIEFINLIAIISQGKVKTKASKKLFI